MVKTGFTHERSYEGETNVWLTPRWLLEKLGHFDLDPCAAPSPRPWNVADRHITLPEDGLISTWGGGSRVFCNPPYGPHVGKWMRKMAQHGNGIALVFARLETADWQDYIFPGATAIFFLRGRVQFCLPDGTPPVNDKGHKKSPGAPSAASGNISGYETSPAISRSFRREASRNRERWSTPSSC